MRIGIFGGRFRVTAPTGEPPDAGISGTPLGLGRLLGNDPEAAVREGMVRISGDAEIAGAFRELLHHARPDLEAELSRLVGAPLAREAAEAARAFSAWGQRAAEGMARDAGELLSGTGRLLVSRAEFEQFSRRVDELVNDVARTEARLQQFGRRD
jgi:ubiquinone biosynthesis protein UbiJ